MSEALGAGYVLDELVGRGATGEVWRGHARSDGREFAIKLLKPELAEDPTLVVRFIEERAVLTGIDHPNLVRVHDLVAEGSRFAVVMDLVRGPNLRRELRERRTLPAAEALTLMAQVLAGVGALHAAGVVHRDLKPENILLAEGPDGTVAKVTDYGTARLVAESTMTRTSSLIGTAEYLAPELAEHGEISAGVDVYSAGVILYELICGVTPFAGGPPVAVLRRHIEQPPGRPDHVDDRLWELSTRLLEKHAGDRPLSLAAASECTELAAALADTPALPPLKTPPPPAGDTIRIEGKRRGADPDVAPPVAPPVEGRMDGRSGCGRGAACRWGRRRRNHRQQRRHIAACLETDNDPHAHPDADGHTYTQPDTDFYTDADSDRHPEPDVDPYGVLG